VLLERCAMLEQRYGLEPGTYVTPCLAALGIKEFEEEVTEKEQEVILSRLRKRAG